MCFGCAIAAGSMIAVAQFSPMDLMTSINSDRAVTSVTGASFVTAPQRVQLERIADANPAMQSFICNGYRFMPNISASNSTPC